MRILFVSSLFLSIAGCRCSASSPPPASVGSNGSRGHDGLSSNSSRRHGDNLWLFPPSSIEDARRMVRKAVSSSGWNGDALRINRMASTSSSFSEGGGRRNLLLRSIPALARSRTRSGGSQRDVMEVSSLQTKERTGRSSDDADGGSEDDATGIRQEIFRFEVPSAGRIASSGGFYYGITPVYMSSQPDDNARASVPRPKKKRPAQQLQDTMSETLDEVRSMRQEMEALRRELEAMKRQVAGDIFEDDGQDGAGSLGRPELGGVQGGMGLSMAQRKRQREFDRIARDVEKWAEELLFRQDGEKDGWVEVECNKMMRQQFNRNGTTKAYLKWMKDSRGEASNPMDDREYPCIKIFATVDAPLEQVCYYLSKDEHLDQYNDLLDRHGDLEDICPHSKICWGQTPQILFVKPRDFVTFCHHKWLKDGTQLIVNQACEHEKYKPEGRGRAYALRGANYIGRDPDDPDHKTRICMLAHASPGDDIPNWASKTAVNALAPIEPFKLFHKINQRSQKVGPEMEQEQQRLQETEMVSMPSGRSTKPAGMAQMGYACFWPNGGGLDDGFLSRTQQQPHEVEQQQQSPSPDTGLLVTGADSVDQGQNEFNNGVNGSSRIDQHAASPHRSSNSNSIDTHQSSAEPDTRTDSFSSSSESTALSS